MVVFSLLLSCFSNRSDIGHEKIGLGHGSSSFLCHFWLVNKEDMKKDEMTIQSLAAQQIISIDYSDDDIIIIDNVKQLAEPSPTRIRMNLIAIALKGKAQVSLSGQTLTFGENQLLLCPPGTVFTDLMFSPDFEFRSIFCSNGILQSFLREKMNIWNEMMYVHRINVWGMEARDADFLSHFSEIMRLLINAPAERYPYRTDCIQGLLRTALLGLCGMLKNAIPDRELASGRHGDTLFQRFLALMNNQPPKKRTVEQYAAELCVSPKYLSAVCKNSSGKTARQWIREHTLEEIRYYLKQTDMPIKQIVDKLGFANPSFFGKYVKEHFGMTPLQFRMK